MIEKSMSQSEYLISTDQITHNYMFNLQMYKAKKDEPYLENFN